MMINDFELDSDDTTQNGMRISEEVFREWLCHPPPFFAGEALVKGMDHLVEARPVLWAILEDAISAARAGDDDDVAFAPVYALYLLAYHRDVQNL